MFKLLKDIIAPKKCYSCNEEWHFLCMDCFDKIEKHYFFDEICYVCKKYSKNFEVHDKCRKNIFYNKVIILTHYKLKIIKKLIADFKFYWKKDIAWDFSELLTDKIIKYMQDELKKYKKEDFLIISPPMSFFRKLKRWYNHSEVLWQSIANYFWFRYEKKLILKAKQTRQQSKLNRDDRLINLKKAFKVDKNIVDIIDKKIIILIDDVISTWTTINEISKILQKYNVSKVIVVTIASWY